jgi:DNA polymerase-3 subunit epsilon
MGRCLSPCLGDLDPNLYRRRLDEVLGLFVSAHSGQPLLDHVRRQMRHAAEQQRYEQAASLQRRLKRLGTILARLGGVLEATHARPRLILAPHPSDPARAEAFWLAGGRLVDQGAIAGEELEARTERAIGRAGRVGDLAPPTHVPPGEIDEVRLIGSWLASHPDAAQLALRPAPTAGELSAFLLRERELDDDRRDLVGADAHV